MMGPLEEGRWGCRPSARVLFSCSWPSDVLVASLLPCRPGSSFAIPLPPSSLPPFLAKVGKPSRSKHNALPSGSLQFRALSKEDHGEWECIATNVVTSITASTHLTVIGTGAVGRRAVVWVLGTVHPFWASFLNQPTPEPGACPV